MLINHARVGHFVRVVSRLGEGGRFSLGSLLLFFLSCGGQGIAPHQPKVGDTDRDAKGISCPLPCNPISDRDIFFQAIQQIETGGEPIPNESIGAAGELGSFQIMRAFHADALEYEPSIGGTFQDLKDPEYSKRIIDAYLRRYAWSAWENNSFFICARIFHGGPRGMEREHTIRYAERVLEEIAHRTSSFTLEIDDSESTRDREGSATLLGRSDGGL